MRLPKLQRVVWRIALSMGATAAALVWIVFIARGGASGAIHDGTVLPLALFLAEVLTQGYAGFHIRRAGLTAKDSAVAGALAGLLTQILSGFWRTSILFLSAGYMAWLQHTDKQANLALNALPLPPLTVLAALVGALLAGTVVGAAAGSIGGSFALPADEEGKP